MKRLFTIELQKIIPFTGFWVLLGIYIVLYVLFVTIGVNVELKINEFNIKNYIQFPYIWNTFTWLASWSNLFLAILLIAITGNEFSFKTLRQNVIDGLTRRETVAGKMLIILLIAIGSALLIAITTIIFGGIYTESTNETGIFVQSHFILIYIIQAIAFMTLGFFIATLIKNTAISIVVFFVYRPLEFIIKTFIGISSPKETITRYFPVEIISNLTPRPDVVVGITDEQMKQAVESQLKFQELAPQLPISTTIFIAIGYIVLFTGLSYVILSRRNL